MGSKRAAHEGSVRQRQDGSWEARIQIAGKRISRYGKTRAEVVAKLRALQSAPVLYAPNRVHSVAIWATSTSPS
jgi:hypothetical protein